MIKELLLTLSSSTIIFNFNPVNLTTCDATITGKDEITFYDDYDGSIYNCQCKYDIGEEVTCLINNMGTKCITDDEIILVLKK